MAVREKISVKEEIKKALLKLLVQKNYIDITVSDLINTAQVARISFYRNFKSIDDVVDSIADNIIENFNINIVPTIKSNDERKWRELLFEMLYRLILMQKEFGISFREFANKNFNSHIIVARVQEKIQQTERELSTQTTSERYLLVGKMNFVFGIIIKWALSGMEETPEEIVNIIISVILKF
ncbi:MAG: TetR/AcrR family transcriptional regulator [Bacteroides sp.]|nr:TetR/AcrR family transcriptional regulator [Bacillota bacterium]MCM1455147.1 TetR/AcrR family transcriptional regulator [Bacteroides sp.]